MTINRMTDAALKRGIIREIKAAKCQDSNLAPRAFNLQSGPVEGARFKKRKLYGSRPYSIVVVAVRRTRHFVCFAAVAVTLLYRPSHLTVMRPTVCSGNHHIIYIYRS